MRAVGVSLQRGKKIREEGAFCAITKQRILQSRLAGLETGGWLMYENFGFTHSESGEQSIKLFIPDNTIDPDQYSRGAPCNIASVSLIGDFQHLVAPVVTDWDQASALPMAEST